MQQTSNYQLNQWAADDRVLREDFNRDNLAIENGLTALGASVVTEQQNREQAVAGAKSEAAGLVAAERTAREQAVTAAKQEAAAAAAGLSGSKADRTEVSAVNSRVDAVPFVKLMEVTTSATVNQVDLSMAGISMNQYAKVIVVPRIFTTTDTSFFVRANGISQYFYQSDNSSRTYFASVYPLSKESYNCTLSLLGMGSRLHMICEYVGGNGIGYRSYTSINETIVPVSGFQTLNFVGENGDIAAGSKFTVYGVRL